MLSQFVSVHWTGLFDDKATIRQAYYHGIHPSRAGHL